MLRVLTSSELGMLSSIIFKSVSRHQEPNREIEVSGPLTIIFKIHIIVIDFIIKLITEHNQFTGNRYEFWIFWLILIDTNGNYKIILNVFDLRYLYKTNTLNLNWIFDQSPKTPIHNKLHSLFIQHRLSFHKNITVNTFKSSLAHIKISRIINNFQ